MTRCVGCNRDKAVVFIPEHCFQFQDLLANLWVVYFKHSNFLTSQLYSDNILLYNTIIMIICLGEKSVNFLPAEMVNV